jgi:cell division topological specificity factor
MFDLFGFLKKQPSSKSVARDRLKLVLIHDRVNISAHILEALREDILQVIRKHFEIVEDEFDIQISQGDAGQGEQVPMLFTNIPIKSVRRTPLGT